MDAVEREALCAEVDALAGELAAERFRHVAGLEPSPQLTPLFRGQARAAHRATVAALELEGAIALAARVASLRVERAQAEAEERWRAAEAEAQGQGPDGPILLGKVQRALPRERDRQRRLALGRALSQAAGGAARDEAVETRARARAEVGLTPDWELVVAADGLLSASDDAYGDVLDWLVGRELGHSLPPRGDLTRADLLFALALDRWSGLFPAGMLPLEVNRLGGVLRLDLSRIRMDDAGRPGQWPGPHALEARVSFAAQGGPADWLGLLDALGQALGAALSPFHRRHPAAAFTLGGLLAGLLLDPGFLRARLGVERRHAPDLARALALRQLFRLRARAAALRVATEVERGQSGAAWHEAHREALSAACRASWPAGLASRDGDAAFLGAQLRGWARAEVLRTALVERCDDDWWRNPRSAELVGSWAASGGDPWPFEEPALALAAGALTSRM